MVQEKLSRGDPIARSRSVEKAAGKEHSTQLATDLSCFLQSLYDPEQGGFRFWRDGHVTLLSTAFAVQTHFTLRRIDDLDRDRVASFLRIAQGTDGHFVDPSFLPEDAEGSQTPDYLRWQFSFFALAALDQLGVEPAHGLAFLAPWLRDEYLQDWLVQRNWDNFWLSSNELMFLLYFLIYESERHGNSRARTAALRLLDCLDTRQDAETGFWGTAAASLTNKMYGAAHLYMFYDWCGRPVRHASRAIDATLSLQNRSGLFGRSEGGACEDYDGVEVLVKLGRQTTHRADEVTRALDRLREAVVDRHRPLSGGFPYRLRSPSRWTRLLRAWRPRKNYRYSGWGRMACDPYEPDTWGTLFRLLAVAAIDTERGRGQGYQSYGLPAWGYFHRIPSQAGRGQPR